MLHNLLQGLFQAYYSCRKNKRNTFQALNFEMNYEANIIELYHDIVERKYEILPSIAFIIKKPVMREVFAGNFRDRVVHHYIISELNPYFEKIFIYDSYSCRVGKGTLFGINQAKKYMRACSSNFRQETYVLKLDIQSFFMSINKELLFTKLKIFVEKYVEDIGKREMLLYLIEKVIFNTPQQNCIIKGNRSDWNGLPKNKSLFYVPNGKGLPIGNLTSQIFANFYLNEFDQWIKRELKVKYYGRYVDDFFLMYNDKNYLKSLIPQIKIFLHDKLGLILHPRKLYLQDSSKGFLFLGAYIKPNRVYIGRRAKTNLYKNVQVFQSQEIQSLDFLISFRQTINSYFGMMKYFDTFSLRKGICDSFLEFGEKYFLISKDYKKVGIKNGEIIFYGHKDINF